MPLVSRLAAHRGVAAIDHRVPIAPGRHRAVRRRLRRQPTPPCVGSYHRGRLAEPEDEAPESRRGTLNVEHEREAPSLCWTRGGRDNGPRPRCLPPCEPAAGCLTTAARPTTNCAA